jgi:Carboxypeptidase regulatory-like domain
MRSAVFLSGLLVAFLARLVAQPSASIFGSVQDSFGRALAGAEVQVQSASMGTRWKARTDDAGYYSIARLPPGQYKVTIRMPGFRTVSHVGALLDSSSGLALDFAMELLTLHDAITVVSSRDALDPAASDNLLMTRASPGADLPANGVDYRMLFDLMPGVVVTPAGVSDGGQFSSDGQRPNANVFRVDGVSVNAGLGSGTLPGSFPGMSLPAMSGIGNTENLGSPETAQSVELRTSDFAPESGERPGATALITTRAGTNGFHGDVFGRVRGSSWNAQDWFANSRGIADAAYPRPFWADTGFVLGGPIWRDRTFFFLSAEGSQLDDYSMQLIAVPTLATRQTAPAKLAALFGSFPYPSGANLGGGLAGASAQLSNNGTLGSFSLRLDQSLGPHGVLFFRYMEAPSTAASSQYNSRTSGHFDWKGATVGVEAAFAGMLYDIRFNYSHAWLNTFSSGSPGSTDALATAGLLPGVTITPTGVAYTGVPYIPSPFPQYSPSDQIVLGVSIPGLGQYVSDDSGIAMQTQWELRDSISREKGRHQFRAGFDGLRMGQWRGGAIDTILGSASSVQGILSGDPIAVTYSRPAQYSRAIVTGSLFAQDTFHLSDTMSLVYGLRWDITPPGTVTTQNPTVSGLWTGTHWQTTEIGIINGTAPWHMDYAQLAPRIGLAWKLPWFGLMLRSGAGLFYDPTLEASIDPINGAPFNSWLYLPTGNGISGSSGASPAATSTVAATSPDVVRFLSGDYPALHLPRSWQWKTTLETRLGPAGAMSASYAGNVGRHLLGNEEYVDPSSGILDRLATLTRNSSNYQALQIRYAASPVPGVYMSVAYTWAHSLDDGSEDSGIFLIHPGYQLNEAWASSSFDVRNALTAAASYRVSSASFGGVPHWLTGWTVSGILRARSGFPINVTDAEQVLGEEFENSGRPDLVPGQPVWITDPLAAGGRRLNPAAFGVPAAGQEGTLGRNAIYGNGLTQIDASLRRTFALFRGMGLEMGLNIFNVLNHPAFADPVAFLSSPLFGQSTSMQNLMLGSGTPNTGMPPLFQNGGSRSVEISLRVSF